VTTPPDTEVLLQREVAMKYKQRGYRDTDHKEDRQREHREESKERSDARKVRRAMERSASVVLRCADCGHQTAGEIVVEYDTTCEKCGSALHNCRNCRYFDSQARFECRQPVPERIPSKTYGNQCDLYEARAVLDATGKRAKAPTDPRDAFDNLFKK
jgi:hypothetical protein